MKYMIEILNENQKSYEQYRPLQVRGTSRLYQYLFGVFK